MATIQERTDGDGRMHYRVQIRLKGHAPVSATFDRRTDAKEWAQQTEAEIKAGRYFKTVEAKKHTVADMIDRYVRDVLPAKRRTTREAQAPQYRWWRERIGELLLSDVTPALVAGARDELASGTTRYGVRRSPSTVTRYMAALSHAYTMAVKEWGWVDDTPMRRVSKPKEPKGRVRFLSDDERTRVLEACRQSRDPYLSCVVLLAISTGMRRGEIMNLTWDRVDFDRRRLALLPEDTKNGTARALPLAGPALEELRALSRVRRIDTNLVFPTRILGSAQPRPISVRAAWESALKHAGIEDFRFHDLRHTAASYLAMNGATLAEIAEILGHKTLAMVKRYAHLTEAHTSRVVERMNVAVFGGSDRA